MQLLNCLDSTPRSKFKILRLILLGAIAFGPGIFVAASSLSSGEFLINNRLSSYSRFYLLSSTVFSGFAAGLFIFWIQRSAKRLHSSWTARDTILSVCRNLYIFASLVPATLLLIPRVESRYPILTLSIIAMLSSIAVSASSALSITIQNRVDNEDPAENKFFGLVVISTLFLICSIVLTNLVIFYHRNFGTAAFDTGIYDNLVWNLSHGKFLVSSYFPGGVHYSSKFDPILTFLVPLYQLNPSAETLLAFQSMWVLSGVFPLYLLARTSLKSSSLPILISFLYLFHPAVHGAILNDFRSLPISIPFLMWSLWAFETGRTKTSFFFAALVLLTRDDLAFLVIGYSLYVCAYRQNRQFGISLLLVSVAYFVLIRLFVMPEPSIFMTNSAHSTAHQEYFKRLIPVPDEGARGMIISLFSNPLFILVHIFTLAKITYLMMLLLPLFFIPLFSRGLWLRCVYGLIFVLLSDITRITSIYYQYSALLLPMLFMAIPDGLVNLSSTLERARKEFRAQQLQAPLLIGALVATLFCTYFYGAFGKNSPLNYRSRPKCKSCLELRWRENAATLDTARAYRELQSIKQLIPADASVLASNRLGGHLSNRAEVYRIPNRLHGDANNNLMYIWPVARNADYVVVWTSELDKLGRKLITSLLSEGKHTVVRENEGLVLYERINED